MSTRNSRLCSQRIFPERKQSHMGRCRPRSIWRTLIKYGCPSFTRSPAVRRPTRTVWSLWEWSAVVGGIKKEAGFCVSDAIGTQYRMHGTSLYQTRFWRKLRIRRPCQFDTAFLRNLDWDFTVMRIYKFAFPTIDRNYMTLREKSETISPEPSEFVDVVESTRN